jgi:hypothetical protein
MSEPEIIVEEVSPNGYLCAVVEQTEGCCYFYLHAEEKDSGFGMKSCWVRNFRRAPEQLDVAAMREGESPLLPRAHCRHPEGAPRFAPGELEVIWAEEGDAAALSQRGEILAVIPSWGGMSGFYGYARDCIGESELCWALGTPETNVQFEKYARAAAFWESWSAEPGPWHDLQPALCAAVEDVLGPHSNYYGIDGGNWPPKAILRIPSAERVALVTIGVGLLPQPRVELHFEDPAPHRRIELGIGLDAALADEAIKKFVSYISGQSGFPWSRFTFLGHGHTIPSDVAAELSGGRLSSVLLIKGGLGAPELSWPEFRGDPVHTLWMIPISEGELRLAMDCGSAELIDRLARAGVNWIADMRRKSVC